MRLGLHVQPLAGCLAALGENEQTLLVQALVLVWLGLPGDFSALRTLQTLALPVSSDPHPTANISAARHSLAAPEGCPLGPKGGTASDLHAE